MRITLPSRAFACGCSTGPSSPPAAPARARATCSAWDKELERELPLAVRSADLWEQLATELPDDFEYDRKGSVVVAETEAELVASAERARVLAGLGVHGEVLDADALRREEPHAAQDLPGGVLYTGDAQLEPRLATAALARAAVRLGAELSLDCEVVRIVREPSGRAIGVETAHGLITCGAVVVAGGVWTPALLDDLRADRCRSRPARARSSSWSAPRSCSAASSPRPATSPPSRPTTPPCRSRWSSSPRRPAPPCSAPRASTSGFDRAVDLSVAGEIARRAARFFPVLNTARALRVYAGLRPLTPDHIPIIGPFADAPNICVATGHEGAGIGLAPATGELVAAWYTGTPPLVPLSWFSPDRFAPVELAAS